ncbi:protein-glutamine gamma-glutamyltransferase K-like [Ptychodera flava]|uniref:protein-glutamine gamma-glutamyltransferase K-like n=1 Tax=Ptychodera flava TaxID=63121 RepID=UPI003969E487
MSRSSSTDVARTNRREERLRRNIPATGRRVEQPHAVTQRNESSFSTYFYRSLREVLYWLGSLGRQPVQEQASSINIVVKSVDLRLADNRQAHHTSDYEANDLLVRRGQPFDIVVEFNQSLDLNEHQVNLEVHCGENPSLKKDTLIRIPFDGEDCKWEVKVQNQDGGSVTLSVLSPANAIVGRCSLKITRRVKRQDGTLGEIVTLWKAIPIYVLFNPWCKDDSVYMDGEDLLEEYVLNETGFIYVGSHLNPCARPWNFGQFEDEVLEASIHLLEASLAVQSRSNPVKVTRRISAMVNSQDDDGVLTGNWSGDYTGGTKPTTWVGSVAILREYVKSKTPICYGQCWVFSGVTTSVLRCLGIPARSVTNFASAHDTDCSMTIDTYWDSNQDPLCDWNSDSIWNFHVWNECWMARSDLPVGYGGWQVIDGTPQETSEGVYQTGPASLTAIRTGHVYYNYDTEFAFAEVNADKVHWLADVVDGEITSKRRVHVETCRVGKVILTKAVGEDKPENITKLYKFQEGSTEERLAVQLACSHGSKPETYIADKADYSIKYQVVVKEGIKIGDDFDVSIQLTNEGVSKCTISHLHVSCCVCHYTGVVVKRCQQAKFKNIAVEPDKSTEHSLRVRCMDYSDLLGEHATMKIYVIGQIEGTNEMFAEQEDFSLIPPTLDIKMQGTARPKIGQEVSLSIDFTNPLDKPLTDVRITLEGPGIQKTKVIPQRNINPRKTTSTCVALTPMKNGKRRVMATLHCKELIGITGFATVDVSPDV